MSEHIRDLGPIEGHEIAPTAGAGTAGGATGPPGPPAQRPPQPPPGPSTDLVPAADAPVAAVAPSKVGAVKAEAVEAWHDIRHSRGRDVPNSRPLPNWVRHLAWVLDDAIPVPATGGRRIGVDGILTLVPGIGDAAGVVLSMIVVTAGVAAGASIPTVIRMLVNVGFEGMVGLVPFGGALFDMVYKANDRNVRLIEADLADRTRTRRSSLAIIAVLVLTVIVGFVMMIVLSVLGITVFLWFMYRLFG